MSNGVDTAVGVDSQVPDDLGVPGSPASPESVKAVSLETRTARRVRTWSLANLFFSTIKMKLYGDEHSAAEVSQSHHVPSQTPLPAQSR